MTITVWQHVDFEGPAAIEEWADLRGYDLEVIRLDLDEPLGVRDALVILGGPMSVYDDSPRLEAEKSALKSYINRGGRVFGVCLGAQLIADVMGAKVYSSGTREAGWRSVTFASHPLIDGLGSEAVVFHWHGDTFDLPPGATLLASNDAFKSQAFCAKDGRVLATQFHFEATRDSLNDLLDANEEYLEFDSPFVQTAEQIVGGEEYIDEANRLLFEILDRWICT